MRPGRPGGRSPNRRRSSRSRARPFPPGGRRVTDEIRARRTDDLRADRPRRTSVSERPACLETEVSALDTPITPTDRHFIRNHFDVPEVDAAAHRLSIEGLVERPARYRIAELEAMPQRTIVVTMECAGNGRTSLYPPARGVRWGDGAVGTAEWTGVPLAALLRRARPDRSVRELVLEGADSGHEPEVAERVAYAMSLPKAKALAPETLIALRMNGEPLRPEHGAPVRAIVPGYYGMAAVKWLRTVRAVAEPFDGFFRSRAYTFVPEGHPPDVPGRPVLGLRVKSLITEPAAGTTVPPGPLRVRGVAWTGAGRVTEVEVRCAGGDRGGVPGSWVPAKLGPSLGPFAWRRWEATVELPGPGHRLLRARARDSEGNDQPLRADWNLRGVENHAVHVVPIVVRPGGEPPSPGRRARPRRTR